MKTIQAGTTLIAHSICDYNCIFELNVLSRKGNFVDIKLMDNKKKIKVRIDSDGDEYLKPDNYSMSPIFRAKTACITQ